MFLQIHTLTGYSNVLLNRGFHGIAKRADYGGVSRTRTSSQFAKRNLRLADGPYAISELGEMAVRSRVTFTDLIGKPLVDEGLDPATVVAILTEFQDFMYGVSERKKQSRAKKAENASDLLDGLKREEIVILGWPEIRFLMEEARKVAKASASAQAASEAAMRHIKENKANLDLVRSRASLDVAMFGRMVTGDPSATMDAAVHVAHAVAVHRDDTESDFFSAVDDLTSRHSNGAAHTGDMDLTNPMLYGYYVVDFKQLVMNVSGVRRENWRDGNLDLAAAMCQRLVHLVATKVVGSKKGATAPYSSSDLVLVEAGLDAPRSLAEAFRKPVRGQYEAAVEALSRYMGGKDKMYGFTDRRWVSSVDDAGLPGAEVVSLPEAARASSDSLKG